MRGRTQFLESIAGLQEERRAKGMPAMKTADVNRLEDIYNMGGDAVGGEGGADIIDSARQFPFNPELGIRRRLAGRNGERLGSQTTEDMIRKQLSRLPPGAVMAMAQEKLAEETFLKQYDHSKRGQTIIASDESFKQWQVDNQGTFRGWGGSLMPQAAQRGENVKNGTAHLKSIADDMKKMAGRQGNPTLPNTGARGEPPAAAAGF